MVGVLGSHDCTRGHQGGLVLNVNQAIKKLDTLARGKKLDIMEVEQVLDNLLTDVGEGSK